jgi:hypothetical protein
MKIRPWVPAFFVIVAVILLGYFVIWPKIAKPSNNSPIAGNQPVTTSSSQGNSNTASGQSTEANPQSGTTSTKQPAAPVQNSDGTYPVLVCDGTKPTLDVAFDSYAGFYPLIYRIMAMPESDHYCINLMPKWYGPNFDQNGYSEAEIEQMLKTGKIDIYFASNGALALYDGNSGLVVWSTDQSAGADSIVARDNISATSKPTFNDVLGKTILTSEGSADHYFALKMLQTTGFTPDMVNIQFRDSPVADFVKGDGDLVTYWDPVIRDALKVPGTTTIVTTSYWRTISDYIVISHDADNNMSDAVTYFLTDYNSATEAFTKDKLADTANLIVNFKFNGQDMADWMFLDKSDPYGSLNGLLDGVAIAKLNDNVTMFETDPTGSNLVKDQFIRAHNTWLFGQVYDNGNAGALFNPDKFITDKYVKLLLNGGAKQVSGDFNNKYDTDVSQTPPAVDSNTLISLPEMLTLPYKNIKFVENNASTLVPGEEEHLIELIQPIANMMAESDSSVIIIKGGSGYFPQTAAEKDQVTKFAFRRALYIRSLLSDKLNIPIQRIIVDSNVLLPDHVLSDAELPDYMVVIIKVVNAGNYK